MIAAVMNLSTSTYVTFLGIISGCSLIGPSITPG